MTDAKSAWDDAGERLTGLGRTVKGLYEEQHGADADAARAEVADAVKRVAEAVQDAFDVLGRAARDPEVKAEVKDAGQSLATAVGLTFSGLSDDLRKTFGRSDTSGSDTSGSESDTDRADGEKDGTP